MTATAQAGREIAIAHEIANAPLNRTHMRVVALCALISMAEGFDVQAMGYVAPAVADHWSVTTSALGGVFAINIAGTIIGGLLAGVIGDWKGRKPGQIGGLVIAGLSMLGCAYAASIDQLAFWRLWTGVGVGMTAPNVTALVAEIAPTRRRATLVGIVISGFALGAVVGGFISASLIDVYGWRGVMLGGGIIPLAMTPILLGFQTESPIFLARRSAMSAAAGRSLVHLVPSYVPQPGDRFVLPGAEANVHIGPSALFTQGRALGTLLLWALMAINLALLYCLINWLPTVLHMSAFAMNRAILGATLCTAAGVAGGLMEAVLADRYGPRRVLTVCYGVSAASLAAMAFGAGMPPWLMLIFVILVGATAIGPMQVLWGVTASFYPARIRSTGVGVASGVGRIGTLMAVIVAGMLLGAERGILWMFLSLACASLLAALAAWALGDGGEGSAQAVKRRTLPAAAAAD